MTQQVQQKINENDPRLLYRVSMGQVADAVEIKIEEEGGFNKLVSQHGASQLIQMVIQWVNQMIKEKMLTRVTRVNRAVVVAGQFDELLAIQVLRAIELRMTHQGKRNTTETTTNKTVVPVASQLLSGRDPTTALQLTKQGDQLMPNNSRRQQQQQPDPNQPATLGDLQAMREKILKEIAEGLARFFALEKGDPRKLPELLEDAVNQAMEPLENRLEKLELEKQQFQPQKRQATRRPAPAKSNDSTSASSFEDILNNAF